MVRSMGMGLPTDRCHRRHSDPHIYFTRNPGAPAHCIHGGISADATPAGTIRVVPGHY